MACAAACYTGSTPRASFVASIEREMSGKEQYASLVENEAKTIEGDATQMQQYPCGYPADTATAAKPPQPVTTTQSAAMLTTYQPQPYPWGPDQIEDFRNREDARATANRASVQYNNVLYLLCWWLPAPLGLFGTGHSSFSEGIYLTLSICTLM